MFFQVVHGLETRSLKPRQKVVKAGCNSVLIIGRYKGKDMFFSRLPSGHLTYQWEKINRVHTIYLLNMAIYGYFPCLCETTRGLMFGWATVSLDRSNGSSTQLLHVEMDWLIIRAMGQTMVYGIWFPPCSPIGNQQCDSATPKRIWPLAPISQQFHPPENHVCWARELLLPSNPSTAGSLGVTAHPAPNLIRGEKGTLKGGPSSGTCRVRLSPCAWRQRRRGRYRAVLPEHLSRWTKVHRDPSRTTKQYIKARLEPNKREQHITRIKKCTHIIYIIYIIYII